MIVLAQASRCGIDLRIIVDGRGHAIMNTQPLPYCIKFLD